MTTLTLHSRRTGIPARFEITGPGFPTMRIGSRPMRRGGEIVIDGACFALCLGLATGHRRRTVTVAG